MWEGVIWNHMGLPMYDFHTGPEGLASASGGAGTFSLMSSRGGASERTKVFRGFFRELFLGT